MYIIATRDCQNKSNTLVARHFVIVQQYRPAVCSRVLRNNGQRAHSIAAGLRNDHNNNNNDDIDDNNNTLCN